MQNFITFDIEEWFRVNYENCLVPSGERDQHLEGLVEKILNICEERRTRCTFFVLGSVADEFPNVIRGIHARGHEIACHSYSHRSLLTMRDAEFRADTRRALDTLQSIIGAPVIGYRAPSFSVVEHNLGWYYRVLSELGFRYSSSVFPGKTFLYGIPGFPNHPHRPTVDGERVSVMEFPISPIRLLRSSIPLYLRLFPATFLNQLMRARNRKGESVMLYLHPREIDPEQPRLRMPKLQSLIHYWGIKNCEKKLRYLVASGPRLSRICDAVDVWGQREIRTR